MDAEPGRCRRTDGKKWRCKLAVLPDQKYCERHVHRGRGRSRKHVEVNKTLVKSKLMSKSTTKIITNLESDGKTTNAGERLELTLFGESVLHQDNGCGTTSNEKTSSLAVISKRCRRTDGKKWPCDKEAVSDQKYCQEHTHEAAKNVENGQKSNTGQSCLVGTGHNHQPMGNDGLRSNDESSSSSDAITISM